MNLTQKASWNLSPAQIFWGEIAPTDHVVQVYENDHVFLDTLAGFVGGGINEGDCIIIIATKPHINELETRLRSFGIHVEALKSHDKYIALDAKETLDKFMVNGWPDAALFNETISTVITRAQTKNNCKVRAFGEMVALLWAEGHSGATVQLEHLWNEFMKAHSFSLFCAYPKSGFTEDPLVSINQICGCHSKLISGNLSSVEHVYYKLVVSN
jgi:hypothetical protein